MTEMLAFERQDTPFLLPMSDVERWRELLIVTQLEDLWWDPEDERIMPDPGAELLRRIAETHGFTPAPEVYRVIYTMAWEIGTYTDGIDDEPDTPIVGEELEIIGGTDE